jgi:hypothetical protein
MYTSGTTGPSKGVVLPPNYFVNMGAVNAEQRGVTPDDVLYTCLPLFHGNPLAISVLGAVFLDAGYDAAYHYYLDRYRALPSPVRDENFKGRLQQVAQERFGETPVYDSEGAKVGNRREYTSVVFAGSEPLGTGHGPTKQEAEQDAAKAALQTLTGSAPKAENKPRRQRAPRKRPEPSAPPAPAPAPEVVAAEVVPMPESRSRQFGEPLE